MKVFEQRYDLFKGTVSIDLDKKTGQFRVYFPAGVKAPKLAEPMYTYKEAEQYIKDAQEHHIREEYFVRKVVFISLHSSEMEEAKGMSSNGAVHQYGTFVGLNWTVCNEYEIELLREMKHEEWSGARGITKHRNYQPYKETRYEVIQESKYYQDRRGHGKIRGSYQLFPHNMEPIILPYREELVQFLINVEAKLETLVQQMTAFFSAEDKDALVARMLSGTLNLLTNQSNKNEN